MVEVIQNNQFISVVLGSMAGTSIVELLLKLFLSHWLDRVFYSFKLGLKDKRGYADAIIDLLNEPKSSDWPYELQYRSNAISDKLLSIGQKELSKKLDSFSTEQSMLRDLIKNLIYNPPDNFNDKIQTRDYVERSSKQDALRRELVEMSGKLKK